MTFGLRVSVLVALSACVLHVSAQQVPSATSDPSDTSFPHNNPAPNVSYDSAPSEPEVQTLGRYESKFDIEFGGRATTGSGNPAVYGAYVGLYDGVRVFDQTFSLHAKNHDGFLFDDMSGSSFGYGGDPNNVTRMRVSKDKWYDFNGSYRRDKNFWDYNLLANPLNPTNSPLNVQLENSAHLMDQSRKMTDLDATLAPQSKVSVSLGYSRFDNQGASYSSFHQGTEALLLSPTHDLSDTYRFGASWKALPKTRLSFEQFFTHVKSDTFETLDSTPFVLSNGTPATPGLSFDVNNNIPCRAPYSNPNGNPPVVNATCNLYTGFSSRSPYRTDIATSQIGFQSSYFSRLDLYGRASYSSAQSDVPSTAFLFSGNESRTRLVNSQTSGKGSSQSISPSADFGASIVITSKLRFDDHFRWQNFRIPGALSLSNAGLFATSAIGTANVFSPTTCPAPYTAATCPQHLAGSGPDLSTTAISNYLGQDLKNNQTELEYDILPSLVARVGYRFERRDIAIGGNSTANNTYYPSLASRGGCKTFINGLCQTIVASSDFTNYEINDHAALFGLALRTKYGLRIASDFELHSADNVYTAIMPRHAQLYRVKSSYVPTQWLNLSAGFRIREMRDLAAGLANRGHNRDYNFTAVVSKWKAFTGSVTYGYTDLLQDINICFVQTPAPSFGNPNGPCATPYLTTQNFYQNRDNFASVYLLVKPVHRIALNLGYTVHATNGSTLLLNPNAPLGPVEYQYHMPNVTFAYEINKRFTFKTGWNYYNYNEDSAAGPTLPRDFRAHLYTTSLRFTM